MTIKEFKELVKDLDENTEIWCSASFTDGSASIKPRGIKYYKEDDRLNKYVFLTNKEEKC